MAAVLGAVAAAADRGRDARQLGRDIVEQLRQVFLAVMAPGLVAPSERETVQPWVQQASPAALTRSIEVLGEALVDQREALDPRLTLEVALVRLTRPELSPLPRLSIRQ